MTEDERNLVMELCEIPFGDHARKAIERSEFLHRFRKTDSVEGLACELLNEAIETRIPDDVECAIIVGAVFGFNPASLAPLITLLKQDWHFKHEDIVGAIGDFNSPDAVNALYEITQWVPTYLKFNNGHPLARKAIYALSAINAPQAFQALIKLQNDKNPYLVEVANDRFSKVRSR